MTARDWSEVEAMLDEAAGLDEDALQAWLRDVPEEHRQQARALLEDQSDFGPWAAEAAARIVASTPRLTVPCDLSHYHVVRRLAAGGMGEVYEAEDPRLKRKVAIKVLHGGAIRRIEEEAQDLARLRHPNICRIYDVGRAEGIDYFVMELLDGVALSERLRKGPLALAEALSIGCALARALAEAHRIGMVHRDVKPANIILTRNGPSLVDFGIADTATAGARVPAGTPPYMAPEQARGMCDPRSDIYSVGAILREMVGADAPVSVRNVIDSCLREDPEERWQSAGDLARALEWLVEPVRAAAAAPWWRRWWTGYAAAALLGLVVLVWVGSRRDKADSPVLLPIQTPRRSVIRNEWQVAVSPDAARVAFLAPGEAGESLVWIRKLSEPSAVALPATVGASLVFWSPDGETVGFVSRGRLQTLQLASGALRSLAPVPGPAQRAVWGEDGHILYSTNNLNREGVIYRIPAAGGTLQRVTSLNATEEELRQGFPALLPGGERFLFVAGSNLMVSTLDEPGHTYLANVRKLGERKLLLRGAFPVGAVGDRVFYVRENKLWSRWLNVEKGQWSSEPQIEIAGVSWAKVTSTGVVLYLPLPGTGRPAWVDRQGRKLGDVPVPEGEIIGVGLSRDGTVLVTRQEEQSAGIGLWVVRDGNAQRIGSGPARYVIPGWSADGKWIFFAGYDGTGLHRRLPVPGAEEELLLPRNREDTVITTTTSDGRYGFGVALNPANGRGFDIFKFDLQTRTREDWSATRENETQPALSPDDRWMAWLCEPSSRGRLCLSPRDEPRNITYLTAIRASEPTWSRDGRHLYFTSGGWLHSMQISFAGARIVAGAPERLFQLCDVHRFGDRYAVDTENRFLVRDLPRPAPDPILVWNSQRR